MLTSRRITGIMRRISVPEDYLILGLLISIALTGLYMRLALQLDVSGLRDYMTSLVLIHPLLNAEVLEPAFAIHFSLVQAFLVFFPFSKLVHVVGSFMTNYWVKSRSPQNNSQRQEYGPTEKPASTWTVA
jgi:nitrate reductase gamma subunit